MTTQPLHIECPSCGQRLSGTAEHVGTTVSCPSCNTDFVVPAPQRKAPATSRAELPVTTQRNPLLIPLIALTTLFVVTVAGGAFYFGRRSAPHTTPQPAAATPESVQATAQPVPATPAHPPKPTVSEDTKARVLNFIEKATKLTAMTEQGVAFTPFTDQLAEVKSVWQTLTLINWPETWNREKANFESAIEGWGLAKEIWERKLKMSSDPADKLEYLFGSGKIYAPRLQAYAETVTRRTEDQSALREFDLVYLKMSPEAKEKLLIPDGAIQWCLSTASLSFDKAREGVKNRLTQ